MGSGMAISRTPLLVIEDNPADLRLLQELLEEMAPGSFDVHSTSRLDEGIAELLNRSYPVVLLDLSLPDAHGLSSVDAVHEVAPDTSLIVLSGLMNEELAKQVHERGASASFMKGEAEITGLITAIRRLSLASL